MKKEIDNYYESTERFFPEVPIIWVGGPIAAGKSTFAAKLAQVLGLDLIEEPVGNNPYLELFYKDHKTYAFAMQIFLLHYRFAMKQKASYTAPLGNCKGIVLDRSICEDRVFAKLHWKAGNISDIDWKNYNYCYEVMARTIQAPTLFVYLDVQPETCFARMKERDRSAEVAVPLEYLRDLRNGYKELLQELRRGLSPWTHSIRIHPQAWDKAIPNDSPEWEYIAKTIWEACLSR
jgi:deoxyadenosine/deoxycytidine kinase